MGDGEDGRNLIYHKQKSSEKVENVKGMENQSIKPRIEWIDTAKGITFFWSFIPMYIWEITPHFFIFRTISECLCIFCYPDYFLRHITSFIISLSRKPTNY